MKSDHELIIEIADRVTRTESRVVQLGDHVGANLRHKQRIEIFRGTGAPRVEIDALDVSISRIISELKRYEVSSPTGVWLEGRLVATVYPKPLGSSGTVVNQSSNQPANQGSK